MLIDEKLDFLGEQLLNIRLKYNHHLWISLLPLNVPYDHINRKNETEALEELGVVLVVVVYHEQLLDPVELLNHWQNAESYANLGQEGFQACTPLFHDAEQSHIEYVIWEVKEEGSTQFQQHLESLDVLA